MPSSSSSNFWLSIILNSNEYLSWYSSSYERVLNEIGLAISKSNSLINQVETEKEASQREKDWIIDDECDIVEHLLGTAFVLCQAYITSVCSVIRKNHSIAKSHGISLTTTEGTRPNIMRFGFSGNNDAPSEIEIINAFANYFKHRDEWDRDWKKLKQGKETAEIIERVGASSGSNSNLRQGSIALGNPEFSNTAIFFQKLEQWRNNLGEAYKKEIDQKF
jgi:hypothetical protein